jgi:hypothetical protein
MNNSWKGVFFILGIIAAVYLVFRYIIPVVFKMLGFVIGVALYVVMWIVIAFFIVVLIGYIVRLVRRAQ